jgi:exosortase/archaeosortase family protein
MLRLGAALAWLAVIVLAHGPRPAWARFPVLEPLAGGMAALIQGMLQGIGIAAQRAGTMLYVPGGFAYDITIGCTGLVPAAVLAVAILASPATRGARQRGLLVGIPLVLAVNVLRLIHLFYIGIYAPRYFVLAHTIVWEGALVLFTFATWLVWARWAEGQGARLASPPSSWIKG